MADKKLFELNENATPADSKRLAIGDASSGAENITLANFYTRLMSKLGFLKVANRLSEYYGNTQAQSDVHEFINVYSKGQVDSKDALKADKSNVIEKNSTTAYTPTLGTHPINKKYIDDKILTGRVAFSEPSGTMSLPVTIGKTMSNTTYYVYVTIEGITNALFMAGVIDKTTVGFTIQFTEYSGISTGSGFANWLVIPN